MRNFLKRDKFLILTNFAFFCVVVGAVDTFAGENAKPNLTSAQTLSEHLSSSEQALNDLVTDIVHAPSIVQAQRLAVTARAYLPSIADSDSRLLWEAAILAAEKDYERAAILLSRVKHFDHGSFQSLELAAKTNSTLLRADKAIELCSLALKKQKVERVLTLRAVSYQTEKKYTEAAVDYVEAARLGYASTNYCRAATCYVRVNEPEKALKCVDKSFQAANGSELPGCYNTKAICLEKLNRPAEAAVALTKALEAYESEAKKGHTPPDRPMFVAGCLSERAKCYEKLGKTAEADRDRKQSSVFAKKVETELFGK